MLGASPVFGVPMSRPPDSDTAAATDADGSSADVTPTFSAVIAPAEEPPIAMRVVSIPYVAALVRRNRTAVCASCHASLIAITHCTVGLAAAQPGGSSR